MNQNLTAPRDGVGILRKTLTAMLKNDDTAADTKKKISIGIILNSTSSSYIYINSEEILKVSVNH